MPMTYSQYLQQNPDEMQAVAGQMAPPPQAAAPAPAPQQAAPAAPPQQSAPAAPVANVAPVQAAPDANYAQAAGQFAGGMMNKPDDGNASLKDKSTIGDVMSIFKMFGGGGG